MYDLLNKILKSLMSGSLQELNPANIIAVSNEAVRIINKPQLDDYDVMNASTIISISQIVYNNTDRSILFLDDGVYDIILEKCNNYNSSFQVGAPEISFSQDGEAVQREYVNPLESISDPEEFKENSLFYDDLSRTAPMDPRLTMEFDRNTGVIISKKNINVPHMYPKLVGSLDKCKFTLNKEAMERDVFDDANVKIFERDFLAEHLRMGLIDMTTPFEMIAELKYDGISVEADVTDRILSARSRGDANNDVAADLSPILAGYKFPFAKPIPEDESFGMKFEAIITHMNLDRLGSYRDKSYANSRNGIIGLFGSSDAYNYRDLITLVPLATSIEDIDRVAEIEFLNKYYNSGEYLRYSILRGTYNEILFQVYKFVKEAETIRGIMPFMYDGVVISYRDPKIIKALGRKNSINKYSIAIKFNPLVREAIFTGYSFTIGQDGKITPMIHYTPVEFYGTIHTKSSGHSYKRYNELNLAIGDVLQIEYANDVMPYVYKPEVNSNFNNPNQPISFPEVCPCCGTRIVISTSGKLAICPNIECPERIVAKMANMMKKLNLKDFGEETFRSLGTRSLHQLFNYTYEDVKSLGPNTADKFLERINEIKSTPIYDYEIMGSIGFTGVAIETWRKILNVIPLDAIISLADTDLYHEIVEIKGVGGKAADTIVRERHVMKDDINCILKMNIISSCGLSQGVIIRYTGCRPDENLTAYLASKGCDARPDAGVTKNTDILVVPYIGFSSSKVNKAGENTKIVDMAAFKANPDMYLM